MSHIFVQRTGEWVGPSGDTIAVGFSGFGLGRGNPDLEDIPGMGPIPCGDWAILGPPHDTSDHGPFVLQLEPHEGTETFGRKGFLIHGDAIGAPGTGSHGCIVISREAREAIWASNDRSLKVVSDPECIST